MVEIPQDDWGLLGAVTEGADSVNLTLETVQLLEDKGYIPGPLELIVFHDPGVKDTNWSATDVVPGVDGHHRRWVYLHVFKAGQPSLNWLDPTFGAQRVILADVVQSLHVLGVTGLRLDANPLMGVEGRPGLDKSWVEGHPLAEGGSNIIAMMIRKLGGYSFQELNQPLQNLKRFTIWGADLSYDFFTRPPYLYAMAVGDAGPLRMMLRLIQKEGLDQGIFVHALQNHDELMFDLTHLRKHGDEKFSVNGEETPGNTIYQRMYDQAKEKIIGSNTSNIREFTNLGFCATLAGFAAAALEIPDPYNWGLTRHRQFAAIRYYLQFILWECVNQWKKKVPGGASNYIAFLDQLESRRERQESICLVTFNYDTMLEDALQLVGVNIRNLEDYIAGNRYKPEFPFWPSGV